MVLSLLYLLLLRAFPKPILHISLVLTPIGALAGAIYYFYIKYYSGAIVLFVFLVIFAFVYMSYRRRIPMAAMFLSVVIDIAKHHKMGVYGTAIITILVQAALGVWFMFTVVATYIRWGNAACQVGTYHFSYPLRLYLDWMTDSIRLLRLGHQPNCKHVMHKCDSDWTYRIRNVRVHLDVTSRCKRRSCYSRRGSLWELVLLWSSGYVAGSLPNSVTLLEMCRLT
jgi:ABC-type multidrug transport system fused ATPase/permease subunit